MEKEIIKRNIVLPTDETKGILIPFPRMNMNENKVEYENDKIIIDVPKGYTAKVIFTKSEEYNLTPISPNIDIKKINKTVTNSIKNELAFDLEYDIMKIRKNYNSTESMNCLENQLYEEGIYMKKSIMYDILSEQLKFLLIAISVIFASFLGIYVYYRFGLYIIHPLLYIFTLIAGIGWLATALTSIKYNRV